MGKRGNFQELDHQLQFVHIFAQTHHVGKARFYVFFGNIRSDGNGGNFTDVSLIDLMEFFCVLMTTMVEKGKQGNLKASPTEIAALRSLAKNRADFRSERPRACSSSAAPELDSNRSESRCIPSSITLPTSPRNSMECEETCPCGKANKTPYSSSGRGKKHIWWITGLTGTVIVLYSVITPRKLQQL